VEGQASDHYASDTDTWTATSSVQSSGKDPAVSSHSLLFFSRSSTASTEHRRLQFCTAVAWPPHHCPCLGEPPSEFPAFPSLCCAPAGELPCTGAAGGQAPVSMAPCPLSAPASVHGGPSTPGRSTETWTRCTGLTVGK
jgi:hypothetical protein